MTIVRTDMRDTIESARRERFEPVGLITETNVQKAIEQVSAQSQNVPSPVPTPVNASPYNVQPTDRILEISIPGAVINLDPTSGRGGLDLQIKDVSGLVSSNPPTTTTKIFPNVADTGLIDAQPELDITADYQAFTLRPGALVWRVGP